MRRHPQSQSWRVFQRRRFAAHAAAWVYAQVPLWWWALLDDAANTTALDVATVIASLLAAVVVVGALVGVAALLRVPWWLLRPLCWLSMGAEWLLRQWLGRSWPRTPARRRWYLSNPVPLWQWSGLRWRRMRWRMARRSTVRCRDCTTAASPRPADETDTLGPSVWEIVCAVLGWLLLLLALALV